MSYLDSVTSAVFIILILLVGLLFKNKSNNKENFFAGGGTVPWWISGLSLFMSFFSVGTFVVWGAIAYTDGLVAVSIQTTIAISGFTVAIFIAPSWNKTKVLTAAEFLTRRFGSKTQKAYSILFLLMNVFTAGAFLYPVGKIIEIATGIQLEYAICLLGIFIIAYTSVGGLWAVLVTDVLQFVVLTTAVVIIIPLSLDAIGGIETLYSQFNGSFGDITNNEYSWFFLFAWLFYNATFLGGNWAYVQRYTSVSSPKDARKVGLLFGGLYLIAPLVWMLPPMIYRVIDPSLSSEQAEDSYLLMAKYILPSGLLGLILTSMIFATASSVNTTINIAAGVITNDIFSKLVRNSSDISVMRMAKLASVVFGSLAILVAISVQHMGGIVNVVLTLAAISGAPLYLPPIWSIFSSKQTAFSILSTTILSLIINFSFKFLFPLFFDFQLDRAQEMMVGVFTPVFILSFFELYYPSKKERGSEGFTDVATSKSHRVKGNENKFEVGVLLCGISFIGLLVMFLGAISETGSSITMLIGIFILSLALFALVKANYKFLIEKSKKSNKRC